MTIDTACSGSLVCVDVACRSLQTRQIDGAVVAGANLYLSPDQNQDMGAMRIAASATGKCHTFDAKADGYCKAEGVNAVVLKRLDDAIKDGDPIRGIIRGTSTTAMAGPQELRVPAQKPRPWPSEQPTQPPVSMISMKLATLSAMVPGRWLAIRSKLPPLHLSSLEHARLKIP